MAQHRRFLWFAVCSTIMGAVLIAWAGVHTALAATPTTPQSTVIIAFYSFSKEVMDPITDGTPGLPYHGQMFDWFIGATPEGKLTTDYGALERYESNAEAAVWTFTLRIGRQFPHTPQASSREGGSPGVPEQPARQWSVEVRQA